MPRQGKNSETNDTLKNVMTSLVEKSGKQIMTAVELQELMQAAKVEMNKLGQGESLVSSNFCEMDNVLDRIIVTPSSTGPRIFTSE